MSGFSADDLVRSVAAVNAGKFGRALSDIERAAATFEASRTLAEVADLLTAINRAGQASDEIRPAVLSAAQQALQLAASAGGPSFRDATITQYVNSPGSSAGRLPAVPSEAPYC